MISLTTARTVAPNHGGRANTRSRGGPMTINGANICRATSHRPTTATLLIGPHFYAGCAACRALTGLFDGLEVAGLIR